MQIFRHVNFRHLLAQVRWSRVDKSLAMSMLVAFTWLSTSFSQTTPRAWPFQEIYGAFKVHSDFAIQDKKLLHDTLDHLKSDVAEVLRLPNHETLIHIVLFASHTEYTRYMQHYFPSIVARRAIYLQDRGPGMLFTSWHDDIQTDLRHEATHALLNQGGAQLPLWLDEGLAEYFEVDRDKRYAQATYLAEVTERVQRGLVPSLVELEQIQRIENFADDHYRDSWAWVHLLLHRRQQTRQLLLDYLSRTKSKTPQPPLSRLLYQVLEAPDLEFQSHFADLQP